MAKIRSGPDRGPDRPQPARSGPDRSPDRSQPPRSERDRSPDRGGQPSDGPRADGPARSPCIPDFCLNLTFCESSFDLTLCEFGFDLTFLIFVRKDRSILPFILG